ncbi:MAG: hypothetical protein ACR5LD_11705 [Symbiopectobacterium sp.]
MFDVMVQKHPDDSTVTSAVILLLTDRYLVGCIINPLTAIRHHFCTLTEGKLEKNLDGFGCNDAG